MYVCTTWKARPLSKDQLNRMMSVWGKLEADTAASTSAERLCWYINTDGSGGVTISKVSDAEVAAALELEQCLALGEFLELDTKQVLDMDSAMPAILKGLEHVNS